MKPLERLILIEEEEQLAAALAYYQPNISSICALSPQVMYQLEKRAIPYLIPEEIFPESEVLSHWREMYEHIDNVIAGLDRLLGEIYPALADIGLGLARSNWFFLHLMLQQTLIELYRVPALLARLQPKELVLPATHADEIDETLSYYNESYIVPVFDLLFEGTIIRYPWRPVSRSAVTNIEPPWWLVQLKRGWRLLERMLQKMSAARSGGAKPGVVFFHTGYGAARLLKMKEFRQQFELHIFPLAAMLRAAASETRAMISDRQLAPLFSFAGYSYYALVASRIRKFIDIDAPQLYAFYQNADHYLAEGSAQLTVNGHNYARPHYYVLAYLANRRGLKNIAMQHGGNYGYNFVPKIRYNDLASELRVTFLSWGKGMKKYAGKYYGETVSVLPVGSPYLDSLPCASSSGKYVLYLPTTNRMFPKGRSIPYNDYPPNTYYRLQQQLVRTAKQQPLIKFVFKMHNLDKGFNPLAEYAHDCRADNITFAWNKPATAFLAKAALVLCDFPSTTLLETLACGRNAFVYLDPQVVKWEPGAAEMLGECCYCFRNYDSYLNAIAEYCGRPERYPRKDATAFLKEYATHRNDGNSRQRLLQAIKDISAA